MQNYDEKMGIYMFVIYINIVSLFFIKLRGSYPPVTLRKKIESGYLMVKSTRTS